MVRIVFDQKEGGSVNKYVFVRERCQLKSNENNRLNDTDDKS